MVLPYNIIGGITMNNAKRILSLLLAVCLVFSLGACAKTVKPDEQPSTTAAAAAPAATPEEPAAKELVTVEFWHALTGANEDALKAIVDAFNAENAGEVEVKLVFQGKYKELFSKLQGAAQAGNLPTLSFIFNNRLTAYIMSGLAENLEPYIHDPEVGFPDDVWENIPHFLRDDGVWDGDHYSVPFNKGSYMLFYNVDILKEKGVEPPTNWDELKAAAAALTYSENGKDIVGLALNKSVGIDGSFWVEQAGGHLYDEATDEILFNQQPGVDAVQFIADLVTSGVAKICVEESYMKGPFSRGDAAMGISWLSDLPDIISGCEESGVNFATVPLPAGKKEATLFSGTNVAMFNTSSEAQKRAAFKFLRFFYEPENQLQWGKESGFMPMNTEVLNSKEFQDYAREKEPTKLVCISTFEHGISDPKILNGYAIHDNMQKALESVIYEGVDAQTAMDKAAAQARIEIEEARKAFTPLA